MPQINMDMNAYCIGKKDFLFHNCVNKLCIYCIMSQVFVYFKVIIKISGPLRVFSYSGTSWGD